MTTLTNDQFENANEHKAGKTDSKTEINADSMANALNELESGQPYTATELTRKIVTGDLDSDYEPSKSELRAFVAAYGSLTNKDSQIANSNSLNGSKLVKRKFDTELVEYEKPYANWGFKVVE